MCADSNSDRLQMGATMARWHNGTMAQYRGGGLGDQQKAEGKNFVFVKVYIYYNRLVGYAS